MIFAQFFKDDIFFKQYITELERLSKPSFLDSLFKTIDDDLDKNLLILASEFPYFHFDKDVLYDNQHYIRTVLNPTKAFYSYYKNEENNILSLDLGNVQSLPIEILNATYKNTDSIAVFQKNILQPFDVMQSINFIGFDFKLPKNLVWADSMINDIKINYKILGTNEIKQESVMPKSLFNFKLVSNDYARQKPNYKDFKFISVNEVKKEISIKPGTWTLSKALIFPAGYNIVCIGGTNINLTNEASIFSYSPIKFIGNEEMPINIQSKDSVNEGFAVVSAGGQSILEYVVFTDLSNPTYSGWDFTGAVTFYESDVQFSNCKFIGNKSEDGVNVVRSKVNMYKSLFSKTTSDAFDGDFITGDITNSSFIDCGNDGIDVSGSNILVKDVFIDHCGDKGLSNGEHSEMKAVNIEVQNTEIAVASKDISLIDLDNVKITGGKIGLTAYQKKPEFGPGTIVAQKIKMINVPIEYLVEDGSEVTVDGDWIPPSREKVKEILYGAEYGKASK